MSTLDGSFIQHQQAFSAYMIDWFKGLYADTAAVTEFKSRAVAEAIKWAPSRMIDEAEGMLAQYRKNENGPPGKTSKLPIILLATDDDFLGTGADSGGQHTGREVVQIEEGGSWYGYRQIMHDRRIQVVIIANEGQSAGSIAAQLAAYVERPSKRYMNAFYQFGQYNVPAPMTLAIKAIDWMSVKTDAKNIKILAGDLTFRCIIPVFDAPAVDEANDGTTNNPPGFPLVTVVKSQERSTLGDDEWTVGDERLSQ